MPIIEVYRDEPDLDPYGKESHASKYLPLNPPYVNFIFELIKYRKYVDQLMEIGGNSQEVGIKGWFDRNISYWKTQKNQHIREFINKSLINHHRKAIGLEPTYPE